MCATHNSKFGQLQNGYDLNLWKKVCRKKWGSNWTFDTKQGFLFDEKTYETSCENTTRVLHRKKIPFSFVLFLLTVLLVVLQRMWKHVWLHLHVVVFFSFDTQFIIKYLLTVSLGKQYVGSLYCTKHTASIGSSQLVLNIC